MNTYEVLAYTQRDALITRFPTIDSLGFEVWNEGSWMRSKLGGAVWHGSFGSLGNRLTKEQVEEALRIDLKSMEMTFLFVRELNAKAIEHRDAVSVCWAAPELF